MSNVAGKAFAMNLLTPVWRFMTPINRATFWAVGKPFIRLSLRGLQTLSMIHYARWVVIGKHDWPRLSETQPRESLHYDYMFFFSNFNGSWAQYVDSFSASIPSGLNLLWFMNVAWPKAVPRQPFHTYVSHNQFWTNHYYSAYPLAASNDVKAGARVRKRLVEFMGHMRSGSSEQFSLQYARMLRDLQGDLGYLDVTPQVSVAAAEVQSHLTKPRNQEEQPCPT